MIRKTAVQTRPQGALLPTRPLSTPNKPDIHRCLAVLCATNPSTSQPPPPTPDQARISYNISMANTYPKLAVAVKKHRNELDSRLLVFTLLHAAMLRHTASNEQLSEIGLPNAIKTLTTMQSVLEELCSLMKPHILSFPLDVQAVIVSCLGQLEFPEPDIFSALSAKYSDLEALEDAAKAHPSMLVLLICSFSLVGIYDDAFLASAAKVVIPNLDRLSTPPSFSDPALFQEPVDGPPPVKNAVQIISAYMDAGYKDEQLLKAVGNYVSSHLPDLDLTDMCTLALVYAYFGTENPAFYEYMFNRIADIPEEQFDERHYVYLWRTAVLSGALDVDISQPAGENLDRTRSSGQFEFPKALEARLRAGKEAWEIEIFEFSTPAFDESASTSSKVRSAIQDTGEGELMDELGLLTKAQVCSTLRGMGLPTQANVLVADGWLKADMVCQYQGANVVVLVLDRLKYAVNALGERRLKGQVHCEVQCFARCGYQVVVVTTKEWCALRAGEKEDYMKLRLEETRL